MLRNRGHSYVLPQIIVLYEAFQFNLIVNCNPERLFLGINKELIYLSIHLFTLNLKKKNSNNILLTIYRTIHKLLTYITIVILLLKLMSRYQDKNPAGIRR